MGIRGRARASLAAMTAALLVVGAPGAGAVTNGEPDGDGHPAVGAIVFAADLDGDGVPAEGGMMCSGALVAPTKLLSAGHCTLALDAWSDAGILAFVGVAFGPSIFAPDVVVPVSGWDAATDGPPAMHDYLDLAVFDLAFGPGIEPITLAEPGYLDRASARGGMRGDQLRYVGFGVNAVDRALMSPRVEIGFDGNRNTALADFQALNGNFVRVNVTSAATGGGGGCFGDSGSALFHDTGDGEVAVAVTSGGPPNCIGVGFNTRVDTPQARAFLDRHGL